MLTIGTLFVVILCTACGNESNTGTNTETPESTEQTETNAEPTEPTADHPHAHYACPMDCENGKQYEESGSCPVCKMDLKEVKS